VALASRPAANLLRKEPVVDFWKDFQAGNAGNRLEMGAGGLGLRVILVLRERSGEAGGISNFQPKSRGLVNVEKKQVVIAVFSAKKFYLTKINQKRRDI